MQFDPSTYHYASRRNVIYAKNGMVHSSVPLAAQIGLQILREDGNAVDAAIAMAASLPLLEPTGNALGSDCFAQIFYRGKLYGLNGSGFSPKRLSAKTAIAAGCTTALPKRGWLPAMVPGAPAAWAEAHRRFGALPLKALFAPAIRYAREGYPVPVTVAPQWADEAESLKRDYAQNPELFQPWRDTFTKDGAPYAPGEVFQSDDIADTLTELSETDCESYYRGSLMKRIVAFSKKTGGYFEEEDFTSYHPDWVEPISVDYRGYTVSEIPPNGHGITALMALNILSGLELNPERETAENYHRMIESMKLAFVDAKRYVADPRYMKTRVSDLLSARYAAARRALIGKTALLPTTGDPRCGGTVYFCTADGEGNMVSMIQSNYQRFGTAVVVPGTGIMFQNRGCNFSLDPASDNCLEGGKKAYHTIIPGFLSKDGRAVGPFGVMGGFMQPQGHVQVITNTLDFHMNPQDCLDAPRFQWVGGKKVQLEREVPAHIAKVLADRGHEIEIVNTNIAMGRGGIIWRREDGVLIGGTEKRCDGTIAAY